jgi:hypothetical protein
MNEYDKLNETNDQKDQKSFEIELKGNLIRDRERGS